MPTAASELKTITEVAREMEVPTHQVRYAIEAYRIEPTQRVGIIRAYDAVKVDAIKSAVRRVANRRSGA
ncbi:MAG: hypothetical protein ABIG44_00335 [Planctomycetota bacterium]